MSTAIHQPSVNINSENTGKQHNSISNNPQIINKNQQQAVTSTKKKSTNNGKRVNNSNGKTVNN